METKQETLNKKAKIDLHEMKFGITKQLGQLSWIIKDINYKWWHDEKGKKLDRNVSEMLCLIHSEISEAMEAHRKGLKDDKLPDREGIEVELADAVIRILDLGNGLGLNIPEAIFEKLNYSIDREDHKWSERAKAGGKKF